MVAYSFNRRFAEPILAGTKRQTIRGARRRHARQGEDLQLYVGMRTRQCRLLGRAVCQSVQRVWLDLAGSSVHFPAATETLRDADDLDAFAVRDGFADWSDLQRFWSKEHPGVLLFDGFLFTWHPMAPAPAPSAPTR